MERESFITEDGSTSFRVPALNETYHSAFGAVTESQHVFIDSGLAQVESNHIRVFEMGFGTGLNALLTFEFAQKNMITISYYTIEKYPVPLSELAQFKHGIKAPYADEIFYKLHHSDWDIIQSISDRFKLLKIQGDLLTESIPENLDMVYFDAFAPDVQPALWSQEIFQRIFDQMNPGGTLVTYSAKGQVRRDLITVGFQVERIPGPPGKREMIRAIK